MHPRHETFARYVADGATLTQAALAAGYAKSSAHVTGSRLYGRVEIKAEVARLKAVNGRHLKVVGDGKPAVGAVGANDDDPRHGLMAMSPTERLTRAWIVDGLIENAQICMGKLPKPGAKGKKQHDAAGANRAFELLDKQLEKLREDAKNQPAGQPGRDYLDAKMQEKLAALRQFNGAPRETEKA